MQTRLIRLGLNPDKTLQVPRSYSLAGWYTKGAAPGEVGPAFIVGHYDSVNGPAVFYRLKELERGQAVQVRRADGSTAKFNVDRVRRFGKDECPTDEMYGSVNRSALRLVTCGGSFDYRTRHYRDNVVVFAHIGRASPRAPATDGGSLAVNGSRALHVHLSAGFSWPSVFVTESVDAVGAVVAC